MVYHGRVKDGVIVLDDAVHLPEGAPVRVDIVDQHDKSEGLTNGPASFDYFKEFIGSAKGLPSDAARNVDHYLYGRPKA